MKDKEITVTADELQKQKLYTTDVAAIMQVRAMHSTPKALVRTYGCQQNVADGERIKGMLSEMGFEFTEDEDEADFILFNTCAIREHAEDRVFGNIGALKNVKRRNPSLLIAVCGCMMEQERVAERIKASFPFVNIVFGTHVIHRLPEMMYTAVTDSKRVFLRGHESKEIIEGLPVRRDGNTRAWVTVCTAATISARTALCRMCAAGKRAATRMPSSPSAASSLSRATKKLRCLDRT